MVRLIKRYGSRKLYDTEESRYVSLEEIAEFVRKDQEVRVVDNTSGDDVTAQTLTQVILEEGRSGRSRLSADLLHELVRRGERALSSGVEQIQHGVDRLFEASLEKVGPLRRARKEMNLLRTRLEQLESSLVNLEGTGPQRAPKQSTKRSPRKAAKKTAKKVTKKTAKKTAARSSRKPAAARKRPAGKS